VAQTVAHPKPATRVANGWDARLIRVAIYDASRGCSIVGAAERSAGRMDPPGSPAADRVSIVAGATPPPSLVAVVDEPHTPRPPAFNAPLVHAAIGFRPDGAKTTRLVFEQTSAGTYIGPREALRTPFSGTFPFTPPGAGTLFVRLAQTDPDSGSVAVVSAEIPVDGWPL
jgi:hypothetical protein